MYDLNDLIDPASGWYIVSADDINNSGQIAAYGINWEEDLGHTLILNPIPEPSTPLLLALAAGILLVSVRRIFG